MTNKKIRYKPISPQIEELVEQYQHNPEDVISVLTHLQHKYGKLTKESILDTARALGIPAHRAYGIVTFYTLLTLDNDKKMIRVCDGPVCKAKGSDEIHKALDIIAPEGWHIERNSCLGLCDRAPAVLVEKEQAGPVLPEDAGKLFTGWRGEKKYYGTPHPDETRVMLKNIDKIEPNSLASAIMYDAYKGLEIALSHSPQEVIDEVKKSGLQGRGGAGFPAGRKWQFVANEKSEQKYVICNADESEPLIFKDRVLLDRNPHQVLEGLAIAGYACGANEGYIYIRGEYEAEAKILDHAIYEAEEHGYLGENIFGGDFSFHVHIHRGAGAYICGEETALIESLEGKRGEPRLRPPYPPQAGYHGKPTSVNNVETLAVVPHILKNGADWWLSLSKNKTPGTKLYMVLGHIKTPTLFEAPFGITLREVIENFGGGMRDGSTFHFALTGGAAGTIVDESLLDVPIDYASSQQGISLGAGAFLILDQSVSPVAFLRDKLHFFAEESCGKCTPCRVGTHRAFEILERMAEGKGKVGDVAELKSLAKQMTQASFCGLGQSVGIPMNSAMEHFAKDFERAENEGAQIE